MSQQRTNFDEHEAEHDAQGDAQLGTSAQTMVAAGRGGSRRSLQQLPVQQMDGIRGCGTALGTAQSLLICAIDVRRVC